MFKMTARTEAFATATILFACWGLACGGPPVSKETADRCMALVQGKLLIQAVRVPEPAFTIWSKSEDGSVIFRITYFASRREPNYNPDDIVASAECHYQPDLHKVYSVELRDIDIYGTLNREAPWAIR